jgi:hypothetical protein
MGAGIAMAIVAVSGLVLPGSIFEFREPMVDPLTVVYPDTAGRILLGATLVLLCAVFGAALYLASRVSSKRARLIAMAVTLGLTIIFGLVYSSGAQDLYHNILDVRTLWVYGDNPMLTPPVVHADDPLYPYVLAWQGSVSAYGPLFYAMGVPFSILAGENLLANVIALKVLNGIGVLALAWLVSIEAERLAPGRGVIALVAIGWNPFLLWETVTNGHNDVLMMVFAVGALALASRLLFSQGLLMSGVSLMVKYAGVMVAPLILVWSWRHAPERERLSIVALVVCGALAAAATYLAFLDAFHEIRYFLTTDNIWKSPIAVITNALEPSLGHAAAADIARVTCWAGVAVCGIIAVRLLDVSARSLYCASFILLGALGTLSRPEFFPWYLLWFIPIGAVLIGSWEWQLSFLASTAGLLTYATFPWSTDTPTTNILYVVQVMLAPLLILGLLRLRHVVIPPRRLPATEVQEAA